MDFDSAKIRVPSMVRRGCIGIQGYTRTLGASRDLWI